MKRAALVLSILLVVPAIMGLAGCGDSETSTALSDPVTPSADASAQPTADSSTTPSSTTPSSTASTATEPAAEPSTTSIQPAYTSWVVSIADDDTFTQGDMTYSIALNLTATNPTQDIAGPYTGSATAHTTVEGQVNGQPLNASAIVNSTKLEFTLEDPLAGGSLATLTPTEPDELVYSGSGTIVMSASGTGNIGPAGGGFQNISGQTIEVTAKGSAVTLSVVIEGHKYTFEGTIGGA